MNHGALSRNSAGLGGGPWRVSHWSWACRRGQQMGWPGARSGSGFPVPQDGGGCDATPPARGTPGTAASSSLTPQAHGGQDRGGGITSWQSSRPHPLGRGRILLSFPGWPRSLRRPGASVFHLQCGWCCLFSREGCEPLREVGLKALGEQPWGRGWESLGEGSGLGGQEPAQRQERRTELLEDVHQTCRTSSNLSHF